MSTATTKKSSSKKSPSGPPKTIPIPTPENDEHQVRQKLEAIRKHISKGMVGVPVTLGSAARYAIVTAYDMLIDDKEDLDEAVGGTDTKTAPTVTGTAD